MAFPLTLLFIALYYVRPFELSSAIQGIPLLPVTGGIAFFCIILSSDNNKNIFKNGTDKLLLGFLLAIALSHLRHTYFQGAIDSTNSFLATFFGYFLVAHSLQTKKQVKIFIAVLTLLTCFLAIEGIREYHLGASYFGVEPMFEKARDLNGHVIRIARIKWLGTFSDPNDLAMAFVLPVPFLIHRLLEKKKKIFYFSMLSMILYGIFLTNSRGGMLAVCTAILFYFILRQKSTKGMITAVTIVSIILLLGPSRMTDMSAAGESAHGRIDSWYSGYQMFMEYPLFGVGQGMFIDYNYLTAHNSFVLVLGELGLCGTFFFTGLFIVSFQFCSSYVWGSYRNRLSKEELSFCSALYASMIGLMVAMFFLSRSYILIPFMMIGLSSAMSKIYRDDELLNEGLDTIPMKKIFMVMISSIIVIRILIKFLI